MTTNAPSNVDRRDHRRRRRGNHPPLEPHIPQASRTPETAQPSSAMLTLNVATTVRRPTSGVLKAGMVLSGHGPRHGANATGALGQTKRNQPRRRPKPLIPHRCSGFDARHGQPGQSIQRYINPSRTSWNEGGAGGGSADSWAITSCGPWRSSSAAVVQWISGWSNPAKRSQQRPSIVSSTSHTAGTCSATANQSTLCYPEVGG
jgi:hypothetical protein